MVPDQHGNFTKPDDDKEVSLLLSSGNTWQPFVPKPEDFAWEDISISASRIPRFNGQLSPLHGCKPWDNYVLGQHLCLASDLLDMHRPNAPIALRLAVHLHDAEEPLGGLGDPSGPVKHSPTFRAIMKAYFAPILDVIADKAGIPRALLQGDPEVKRWDKMAYQIENAMLRGIGKASCPAIPQRHHRQDGEFSVWRGMVAHENWMSHLQFLLSRRFAQDVANGTF